MLNKKNKFQNVNHFFKRNSIYPSSPKPPWGSRIEEGGVNLRINAFANGNGQESDVMAKG